MKKGLPGEVSVHLGQGSSRLCQRGVSDSTCHSDLFPDGLYLLAFYALGTARSSRWELICDSAHSWRFNSAASPVYCSAGTVTQNSFSNQSFRYSSNAQTQCKAGTRISFCVFGLTRPVIHTSINRTGSGLPTRPSYLVQHFVEGCWRFADDFSGCLLKVFICRVHWESSWRRPIGSMEVRIKVVWGKVSTCYSVHSWRLHSAAPLGY